jgi:hypothetical protein
MNANTLMSEARRLMGAGNLGAAAALAILPLSAAVAKAGIVFNNGYTADFDQNAANESGSIDNSILTTSSGSSSGSVFTFSFNVPTSTDAALFSAGNNSDRRGNIQLSGTTSGSFDASESVLLNMTVVTTFASGSKTSVEYAAIYLVSDDNKTALYEVSGEGGPYGTSTSGNNTLSIQLPATGSMTYTTADKWLVIFAYDWSQGEATYSTDELLGISVTGTLSVVSSVPEASSWGLIGGATALGAVFIGRRRMKRLG